MARVLLLVPSATYRAPEFLKAAKRLDVEVVVGCDRRQALDKVVPGAFVKLDFGDPSGAAKEIAALEGGFEAVVAVDDQGALCAAVAAEQLGLRHAAPEAVAAARDKVQLRRLLADAGVTQPDFAEIAPGVVSPEDEAVRLAEELGFPVVVKPSTLSGSRGVIRADDEPTMRAAISRIRAILEGPRGDPGAHILVERYVPGPEFALEGLLENGELAVLALFDKPDPLIGPFFEETIYLTPSALDAHLREQVARTVGQACQAIGLTEGPVHAEVRITPASDTNPDRVVLLEVAARTIGGRCSKALRFAAGRSLEELVLAQALGQPLPSASALGASGVMMLPIPASGRLRSVGGLADARSIEHVTGIEITVAPGAAIEALPEGDRYLGFAFARAQKASDVESALRAAYGALKIEIDTAGATR